jgi:hypothetical protein
MGSVRRGVVLSEAIAVDIYKWKLTMEAERKSAESVNMRGRSSFIANIYDVSPKTVRDIWNHITWKYATAFLWPEEKTGSTGDLTLEKKHPVRIVQTFSTCSVEMFMGRRH